MGSLADRTSTLATRRPVPTIAALSAATLLLAAAIPGLDVRTDGAALHPEDDPAVSQTRIDRERFDERDQAAVLLSSTADGPPLLSARGLEALRRLHERLETIPELGATSVTSLASLIDLASDPDTLALGGMLDEIPEDPGELARLIERIEAHPLGLGLMLGRHGRAAALYVHLDESLPRRASVEVLESWLARETIDGFEARLTGPVVAEVLLGRRVLRDLRWQVPIVVVVIAGLLYWTLRTIGGVLIPLVEALFVLGCTFGAMAWSGEPVTLVTTVLPVVLLAIAITDEIHLLQRLQDRLAGEADAGRADEAALRRALRTALDAIERPIVTTSLTTALGFLSFLTASIAPLRAFGAFTALGILLAMAFTFTLIPALVVSLPPRWFEPPPRPPHTARGLPPLERLASRRSGVALAVASVAVLLALPGVAQLRIQDSWVANFEPTSPLAEADRLFNDVFWGSHRLDVVMEAAAPGFFSTPSGAGLVETLAARAAEAPHVGGVLHGIVPLAEIARSLDVLTPVSGLSARQIADLETLLEMRGDSRAGLPFVDPSETRARILVYVKNADYRRGSALVAQMQREVSTIEPAAPVRVHLSGDVPVALAAVRAIVGNQLRSIALTLAGIACLLALASRSLRRGCIALLPACASLVLLFGAMGQSGTALGIATSMFASLTVGIGVDFAIHFEHTYTEARRCTGCHAAALQETLANAGAAIRWNVAVLAVGFSVLMLSGLAPNRALGLLLASAMLVCYAMTVLVLPELLRRAPSPA